MDANNWRSTPPGGEPGIDTGDWRTQLQPQSRQRIIIKIMETLKKHLPVSGQEGLTELEKIAGRFEEKTYTAATSQPDYLRRISMRILTMEQKTKPQNPAPSSLPSNSAGNGNQPPDPGSGMPNHVHSQGQTQPIPLSANQPQARQQMLSQNIQNNMSSAGVQGSSGLPAALAPIASLTQTSAPNVIGQSSNMQNISGVSQNSVGNSMGQGVPSNIFANSQRQIQGRQQALPQQQQQQSQNPQQYMYQQKLQQLMKQKLQQGNIPHSLMQPHIHQQQQQQQNQLQPSQLQSPQQSGMQTSSVMQPSMVQSAPLSSHQQNQQPSVQQSTQSMIQQHPQSVLRPHQQQQQAAGIHQQSIMSPQQQQQQQQLLGQPSNAANMQQSQLIGQQNSVRDMQQQQRLLGQQSNLSNLQQQQQQQQPQLMAQQNLSNIHHQQLGPQSNSSGLQQQQQLLGTQSGSSSMQTNQHSVHMLQQSKVPLQQTQPNAPNLLSNQGQHTQPQLTQQHLMSQIQSQPAQMQQQLGLQQQPNLLQRDIQQRIQAPGSLLQPQNVMDQQKQLYQSQRALPDTSSTSLDSTAQTGANGSDWQEEVYQKIKAMRDMYFPELNEMYQKIASKLQQHESLPQPPKSEQFDRFKAFKTMLERTIAFLQLPKNNIQLGFKEKLGSYEKQIVNLLNTNRPRKPVSSLQQGQLTPPHMHPMQQPQSQITQVQSNDNQLNPQIQSMNLQGPLATMQQNNMTGLQNNSISSISRASTAQQSMLNSLQPGSNLDSGQGNALSSLQQVTAGSLLNSVSAPQQTNNNNLSSQNGVNMLQSNINPLHSNLNMLHFKQQEQQIKQQIQQRQMQHQMIQKHQQQLHQQQQQLHQQAKQQLQTHQMPQLHHMNDVNDLKMRQGMGVKQGVFQPHMSPGQRSAYPHQQLKSGAPYHISSPQLQAASPQMSQHSSPQVDQQNILSSLSKTGTPLQSANSPFVVPSPSTPLAPSPMPGDSEKPISGISSLSNAGNIGHQQTTNAQAAAPSLAIGTPGISASPLLAEFPTEGTHGNAMTTVSGKPSATEQPLERLIRAVKSISPRALSASVSDIRSVVSMVDEIAGSAPGNGSRAAVGEDLVAMTKCRLQARNFTTQDGMTGPRKMRRYTSAVPINVASSAGSMNDSFKQLTSSETSDLQSTATSSIKRPRIEVNHGLSEEIKEINQRLIDTVVDISDEDVDPTTAAAEGGKGTIVKCSFSAVAFSPNLKSQYASAQMSPIQPLRLLVPTNYPNCSPVLLDKFPVEVGKEYEDLSVKAKSRFSVSLRSLSEPISLGEIAKTWDVCARAVISEYAQQSGGGNFSSKYGSWENCLSAA